MDGTGQGGGTPGERKDRWSDLAGPARIAEAVAKLERLNRAPSEVAARRRYFELLAPRPGEIIVDVGAGSGIVTIELARRVQPGGRIFAVDPSAAMLEHARASALAAGVGPVIDCRVADGRKLPFGPAAFDAAFCHWVLLHVDPPRAVVSEMRRVTRRGGRIVAVELDWDTVMVHPGEPGLTRRILGHNADRHVDGRIGRKLPGIFRAAGLKDVTVEPIVAMDEGGDGRAWLDFLHERAAYALDAGVISQAEAVAWAAGLEEAHAAKTFFFGITEFAVLGRVPD